MDKSYMLQRQIKENSEDLQKEFLDMEAWEEQMKKKDIEIRNSKNDQNLPAVRSKIKKKSVPTPEISKVEKSKKTKRGAPLDYDAWNKFDAEEACREIDGNSKTEKREKVYEIPSKEELEKEYEQAIKFKNEGNIFVKEQQYAKAVGKYSEAIKVFPHDAVFYANRALCQLKLNNLYSAEGDCTEAIKLDQLYVKAYHRRATARIELKRYNDAQKDLEIVLKLDPSNKEAANMLVTTKKKIDASKPLIIAENINKKTESIEKTIGEKLFGEKLTISNQDKKNEKNITKEITKKKNDCVENTEDQINKKLKTSKNKDDYTIKKSGNTSITLEETGNVGSEFPSWLPKIKKGINIVEPLTKASGRLNQTLKRICINEILPNESIFQDIEEIKKEDISHPISQLKDNLKIDNVKEFVNRSNSTTEYCNTKKIDVKTLPPPPKSSVAFITNWRKINCSDYRYKYLKQINPSDIPDIFKESMESNIFSQILLILNTEFISNNDKVYDVLTYCGKVKRFRALLLFMTQEDKKALKNLFDYCKTNESKTDEEISHLRSIYEM